MSKCALSKIGKLSFSDAVKDRLLGCTLSCFTLEYKLRYRDFPLPDCPVCFSREFHQTLQIPLPHVLRLHIDLICIHKCRCRHIMLHVISIRCVLCSEFLHLIRRNIDQILRILPKISRIVYWRNRQTWILTIIRILNIYRTRCQKCRIYLLPWHELYIIREFSVQILYMILYTHCICIFHALPILRMSINIFEYCRYTGDIYIRICLLPFLIT